MRRHRLEPRPDWREHARTLGFAFADIAGEPYWDETACWEFTADEIDTLEAATAELERLARLAADDAVRHDRHEMLGIPQAVWPLVAESWRRQEPSLYGRMDLRWDGTSPPKLLEYNADTPTSLYESAVVQWEWLTCAYPDADQFNSIHEALIAAWPSLRLPHRTHFACNRDSEEDRGTVDYLRDTAMQAGLDAPFLFMDEIGWDGRRFVDLDRAEIRALLQAVSLGVPAARRVRQPPRRGTDALDRAGLASAAVGQGPARAAVGAVSRAIPICCRLSANPAAPAASRSPSRCSGARAPTSLRPATAPTVPTAPRATSTSNGANCRVWTTATRCSAVG